MKSESTSHPDPLGQLEQMRSGLKDFVHAINNPLGVLRMAVYFLESTNPDPETRARYTKMINESLDRIEQTLNQLSNLRDNLTEGVGVEEKSDHSL